ncbi:MAG: HNH endonuclease [Bdellovibrionota bacterium]
MKNLNDENLLTEIQRAVKVERAAITQVLQYLAEVEVRNLHLARGYSSLWDFATKYLGYSEGEAYARIQAMRLIREVPSAEEEIRNGKISLTVAADTKSAFVKESKRRKAPLAAEEKQKIFDEVKGKSKREAEKVFQNHFGGPRNDASEKLVIHASAETLAKIEELKGLYAHQNFDGDISKLFELMLDVSLKEAKKKRTEEPARPVHKPSRPQSRHIPRRVRREVWRNANHECSYVDPVTGRKCGSKHALELDHVQEWSRGGTHDPENLRLLCSAHNKFRNFQSTA